jgi:hypothetical protein
VISKRRLYGPGYAQINTLRRRIVKTARAYVYRAGRRAEILISDEPLERSDLIAVYDCGVTNMMIRSDLYDDSTEEETDLDNPD